MNFVSYLGCAEGTFNPGASLFVCPGDRWPVRQVLVVGVQTGRKVVQSFPL